jgi:hypothetical protein
MSILAKILCSTSLLFFFLGAYNASWKPIVLRGVTFGHYRRINWAWACWGITVTSLVATLWCARGATR